MNKAEQQKLYEAEREAARVAKAASRPFDRPARTLARTVDVETSHAAAAANPDGKRSQRALALAIHAEHPDGLIDDEVSALSGGVMDTHAGTRRCLDLRNLGLLTWLVGDDDEPVLRKTRSNRNARVSVLTPAGREALK